jgi:hypothetical protein
MAVASVSLGEGVADGAVPTGDLGAGAWGFGAVVDGGFGVVCPTSLAPCAQRPARHNPVSHAARPAAPAPGVGTWAPL